MSQIILTPWEKSQRLAAAMQTLVHNTAFVEFVDELRNQQRNAMLELVRDEVVKDERLTLSAIGEIRCYESLIALYQNHVDQLAQKAEQDVERRSE